MERLKLYHGSNAVFDEFDQKKARIYNDNYGGGVAYFTDNLNVAKKYAKAMSMKSGKPTIYSAYVQFKKLFDLAETFTGQLLAKFVKSVSTEQFARGARLLTYGVDKYNVLKNLEDGMTQLDGASVYRGISGGNINTTKARSILIKLGFDGLKYQGGLHTAVYLPYNQNQIQILQYENP